MAATYQNIVVLTGAGISAESGLKTFRDSGGLWEGHKVEEVATPEAFIENPTLVHDFYNARRKQLIDSAKPNLAHKALAEFANQFTGDITLVTQNVDNLHEQAGSKNVLHMHGELLKLRCNHCETIYDLNETCDDLFYPNPGTPCSHCHHKGTLRPDIVWFGEIPKYMEIIEQKLTQCDLFISIGTSGQVYPAAGFVQLAKQSGANTVELNLEPCQTSLLFDEHYMGKASETLPAFLSTL